MKPLAALALAAVALPAAAQQEQREIQRALIQCDQQSAEFAAGVRGADRAALDGLHARQLREVATQPMPVELHPYQRQKMAEERALVLPPPVVKVRPPEKPLPLPGSLQHGVEPIAPQSARD